MTEYSVARVAADLCVNRAAASQLEVLARSHALMVMGGEEAVAAAGGPGAVLDRMDVADLFGAMADRPDAFFAPEHMPPSWTSPGTVGFALRGIEALLLGGETAALLRAHVDAVRGEGTAARALAVTSERRRGYDAEHQRSKRQRQRDVRRQLRGAGRELTTAAAVAEEEDEPAVADHDDDHSMPDLVVPSRVHAVNTARARVDFLAALLSGLRDERDCALGPARSLLCAVVNASQAVVSAGQADAWIVCLAEAADTLRAWVDATAPHVPDSLEAATLRFVCERLERAAEGVRA